MMHPAIGLLMATSLAFFWLIPLSAWLMLRGRPDDKARLWFAGALGYAIAALLFALQGLGGPVWWFTLGSSAFSTLTVLLMSESLRRELSPVRTRWPAMAAIVAAEVLVLALLERRGLWADWGRPIHLLLVTALEVVVIARIVQVQRRHRGRSLWVVAAAFLAVMLSNAARLASQAVTGHSTGLLDFTALSNVAFVANFVAVIFYSFGYFGFVLEKSQALARAAQAETDQARRGESTAMDREQAVRDLLRERDALIARLALMQRAAQAGALSASIAHEINQPLAVVRLDLEEAISRLDAPSRADDGPDRRLLGLLQRAATANARAARTVSTLRDVFSARATEMETRTLDAIVAAMAELMRARAEARGFELRLTLDAAVRVRAGAGELEHVVLNLLTNALDAAGSTELPPGRVSITTRCEQGRALLTVADTGPGVPAELREVIFELLRGTNPHGMGLGLWLSRSIVERHGGRLQLLEGAAGQGACFEVELPRVTTAAADI